MSKPDDKGPKWAFHDGPVSWSTQPRDRRVPFQCKPVEEREPVRLEGLCQVVIFPSVNQRTLQ